MWPATLLAWSRPRTRSLQQLPRTAEAANDDNLRHYRIRPSRERTGVRLDCRRSPRRDRQLPCGPATLRGLVSEPGPHARAADAAEADFAILALPYTPNRWLPLEQLAGKVVIDRRACTHEQGRPVEGSPNRQASWRPRQGRRKPTTLTASVSSRASARRERVGRKLRERLGRTAQDLLDGAVHDGHHSAADPVVGAEFVVAVEPLASGKRLLHR